MIIPSLSTGSLQAKKSPAEAGQFVAASREENAPPRQHRVCLPVPMAGRRVANILTVSMMPRVFPQALFEALGRSGRGVRSEGGAGVMIYAEDER